MTVHLCQTAETFRLGWAWRFSVNNTLSAEEEDTVVCYNYACTLLLWLVPICCTVWKPSVYIIMCEFVRCCVSDIKPSAVHVGNIVQGARMAWAQGRDLGISDEESESRKVSQSWQRNLSRALKRENGVWSLLVTGWNTNRLNFFFFFLVGGRGGGGGWMVRKRKPKVVSVHLSYVILWQFYVLYLWQVVRCVVQVSGLVFVCVILDVFCF